MAAAIVGEINETDIPDVADFLARQVPPGEAKTAATLSPVERLRWLLLENPSRRDDIPFGWRIRDDAGAVVAAAICAPFRIRSGKSTLTALMFSKFYVDVPFRGMGLGMLLRFVRLDGKFPLFCTSTNAVAGALFQRIGASKINGLDHTMLGIVRPAALVEEWLYRRTKTSSLARLLSAPAQLAPSRLGRVGGDGESRGQLLPLATADELSSFAATTDAFTAVVRDRDFLHWRYFTGERDKQVYRFTYPGEADRLIVINQPRAGHRGQIRVLNVLDVWPPTSAESAPALCAELSLRYAGSFDVIWLRSQPVASEESLIRGGFIRRDFPAPLGWYIDRLNRLENKNWYVMPGESE